MDRQPEPIASRDCVAEVRDLMAAAQRRAAQARRRFKNTVDSYRGRYDLAWWPEHPEREPACPGGLFFYRPGQLLVRTDALAEVQCILTGLGISSCVPDHPGHRPATRIIIASGPPAHIVVRQLRQLGLGPRTVTLNHVWWPSTTPGDPSTFPIEGAPWLSGGSESIPVPESGNPDFGDGHRGAGVNVAVFDSALLRDWATHSWMGHVSPVPPGAVEDPDAPANAGLDIYDSHGVAVAGALAARAQQATIHVHDVLDELGDVDEWSLIGAVCRTLQDSQAGPDEDRIHIVNLSLGGTTMDNQPPLELESLITDFPQTVFVAAAGNNGLNSPSPVWPAAFPGVIGVGALDANGNRASFSNDYPSADVWAPGKAVLTAFGSGPLDYPAGQQQGPFHGMARWSGTSFAAPYVSGLLCAFIAGDSQSSGSAGPGPAGPSSASPPGPASPSPAGPHRSIRALRWLVRNESTFQGPGARDHIQISDATRIQYG